MGWYVTSGKTIGIAPTEKTPYIKSNYRIKLLVSL